MEELQRLFELFLGEIILWLFVTAKLPYSWCGLHVYKVKHISGN